MLLIPALGTVSVKRVELLLFAAVVIIGLSVGGYLYFIDRYSLVYYGDSVSHMVGARKIVDSMHPGIHEIGTVWLPLPHFLLLPFTLIDPLFTSGFAGAAVSLPSLAITSVLLYKIIRVQMGISSIALAGALLYSLNPNVIYLGLTAMTEAPFILFFVAAAYYFQRWYRESSSKAGDLLKCSLFISLASLSRYEIWFVPILVTLFIIISVARRKSKSIYKIDTILVSLLSLSGIVIWLSWNAYQYGNPLEFANMEYYSAASQALTRPIRDVLFLQPLNVVSIYGVTASAMYGPAVLAAAMLGYIFHLRSKGRNDRDKLHAFLGIVPLFTLISLLIGIGEMTQWFNSRFVLLAGPLVIILTCMFLQKIPMRIRGNQFALGGIVTAMFLLPLAVPEFEVVTLADARNGFLWKQTPFAVQTGEALASLYDYGNIFILTGAAQEHRIMLTSGIPLRHFDEILESSTWKDTYTRPWLHDRWMVIGKEPGADAVNVSAYWMQRQDLLDEHYDTVYDNQYYRIMKLK